MQKMLSIYFSTITFLYIFSVNALNSTPSWINGRQKLFIAYISQTGRRTCKIKTQELSTVYLSTINILYIFPIHALLSTPSWKNCGRKRFNAYITLRTGHYLWRGGGGGGGENLKA